MQDRHITSLHVFSRTCIIALAFVCAYAVYTATFATTLRVFSDRLSDSAPGESSNHTITFTTSDAIPPGSTITFTPEDGEFTIPASDFDIDNVALYSDSGSGFVERLATTTPSATEDGIVINSGTSGSIQITLNSSEGVPALGRFQILLGSHTPNATSTDVGITNPSAPGTYDYRIVVDTGSEVEVVTGKYAIVESVHVGDVDTREFDPPVRYGGAPTGNLSGTSISVELSLRTNEFAKCRYSTTAGVAYFSMNTEMNPSTFSAIHTKILAVTASTTYEFYIRCIDDEGNMNTDDYLITFTVLPVPPGTPGSEGTQEGQGSGTGEGSGDSENGSGDPTGSDDASGGGVSTGGGGGGGGGGTGPSSGGNDGGGGFEGIGQPYQSGDAEVTITGYAFPRSRIVALVDGEIAEEETSDSSGEFSITLEQIARGAYSFGVYGIDKSGVKSSTFTTTFSVIGARKSTLSNINVMPSIKVSPDPVNPNSTLSVSGYSIPNATITIENQPEKSSLGLKTFSATSDSNGAWSTTISTDNFSKGTYKLRAKALQSETVFTNFSGYTFYGVGEAKKTAGSSDLNRDSKVNLTDFSILLFWWNSSGGASNPPADINQDGKVSLTDFSIMIFNWTG